MVGYHANTMTRKRTPTKADPPPPSPIQLEQLDTLTPHPDNPRRGDITSIMDSIKAHGFYGALVAQVSTRHILAGNHRAQAAARLGIKEAPVVWLDIDDDQARRILLVDNRTNDLATYDTQALVDLLQRLQEEAGHLAGTGYTQDDLHALIKELHPDDDGRDDAAEKIDKADHWQEVWQVHAGDVWRIPSRTMPGRHHHIACGDSTDPQVVAHATQGAAADLVFTDPPYGVAYVGKTPAAMTIKNDELTGDALRALVKKAVAAWPLRPGGAWYVCSPPGPQETDFRLAITQGGQQLRQQLVWIKNALVLGHSDYHYRHETILYGWAQGAKRFFTNDRTHTTALDAPPNPSNLTKAELVDLVKELRREVRDTTWLEDRPARSELHPTTKPIFLVTRAIRASSRPTDLVFDGFNGSGTTGLAAEATARTYAGIELDPRYVAVTLQRFTEAGLKPERLTGGHSP